MTNEREGRSIQVVQVPEGTVRPRRRVSFDFSRAFPADNSVAKFVLSIAAAMNDLLLSHRLIDGPAGSELLPGERMALFRQIVGQIWEASVLVRAADKDRHISTFLDGLPVGHPDPDRFGVDLAALRGKRGPYGGPILSVLKATRDWTWHYPKPDDARLSDALTSLARESSTGALEFGATTDSIRATFADEVLFRITLVHGGVATDEPTFQEFANDIMTGALAVIDVAQTAAAAWFRDRLGTDLTTDTIEP